MISPTSKASQRTKNRIREHGPSFRAERSGMCGSIDKLGWLVRAEDGWLGWLPRDEFHIECVDEKFIKKVLDK